MPLTKEEVLEKIKNGKSFKDVEIGDIDFSGHVFTEDINFSYAVFSGYAKFDSVIFEKFVNFSSAIFKGEAKFYKSKFEKGVYFPDVSFNKSVIFNFAIFDEVAYFSSAVFNNKASFDYAIFNVEANFFSATFDNHVSFSYATFNNTAIFHEVKFKSKTDFTNTIFEDRVYFIGDKSSGNLCFYNEVIWTNVRFLKPKLIDFISVDFSKCFLAYADFSSVNLVDIKFPVKNKRKVIYDEIRDENNIDFPIVENAYRNLKIHYENSGNYPFAGDFHFGEMEMKRLSQKPFFRCFSLTSLYRCFSGYGEKFWRTVLCLFVCILVFSSLSLYTGLEYRKTSLDNQTINNISPNNQTKDNIEYFLFSYSRPVTFAEYINDLYTSISHSTEVIMLKRDKLYESFTNTGRIFEFIQVLFTSIFATLSILALKRKLHR